MPARYCQALHLVDLPEATREEQLGRWGVEPERTGEVSRRERHLRDRLDGTSGDWLTSGGWMVIDPAHASGEARGGLCAHTGVLHPDEYVDMGAVASMVVDLLGFSLEDVTAAYRQGPKSPGVLRIRETLDARFLEIAEGGGSMVLLARALGFAVKANSSCRTIENALSRARAARVCVGAVA